MGEKVKRGMERGRSSDQCDELIPLRPKKTVSCFSNGQKYV